MKWLQQLWKRLGWWPEFTPREEEGIPNLEQISPGLWRMGQPADVAAWHYLWNQVYRGDRRRILVVKLNDDHEGNDDYAEVIPGWTLVKMPIPPEGDRPWTVLQKPDRKVVSSIVDLIVNAHIQGYIVCWHCTHGRDRTSLISALVGMRLFGWSKQKAWQDMLEHGFRWELPDLDAYWVECVQ